MTRVLPSQIVDAIEDMFGPGRQEIDEHRIGIAKRAEVHALLSLLDQVQSELIDLPFRDYLELCRCRGVLAAALSVWTGNAQGPPAKAVSGKDPVERIHRLLKQCRDEVVPQASELLFIPELEARLGIEDRIQAAWIDFKGREWMGATVFAGAAIEALLLWALKRLEQAANKTLNSAPPTAQSTRKLDELHLAEFIDRAHAQKVIGDATASQARLAKDARNLIHPGRSARLGTSCNKGTALTALAGLQQVVDDLARYFGH
jgi:hypothetical protein